MLDIFKMPLHHTIIELWKADQEAEKHKAALADYTSTMEPPDPLDLEILETNIAYSEHRINRQLEILKELEDKANVDILTEKQKILEFCIRLIYKFTHDKALRDDIKKRTHNISTKWKSWRNAEWIEHKGDRAPKSFGQVLDGINQNLDGYEEMLNLYAKMPYQDVCIETELKEIKQEQSEIHASVKELGTNIKSSATFHKANPKRKDMAIFIVKAQKELRRRRQNQEIVSDPSKIKTPSINQAVSFIKECAKNAYDKWHQPCANFFKDVASVALAEGKDESTIIRGLLKDAQPSRIGKEKWASIMGQLP